MSLHAVILAGGSGTRFWPLSRAKKPKQFLALVTGRTLIAETFLRVEPLCSSDRTWVVCGKDHAEPVRPELIWWCCRILMGHWRRSTSIRRLPAWMMAPETHSQGWPRATASPSGSSADDV